jgi:hypothetical protein
MKTKKHIFIVVVIAAAIILAFLLWGGSKNSIDGMSLFQRRTLNSSGEENTDPSTKKPYLHSDNSFSFMIPGDFTFSPLTETNDKGEESETVLFKGNSDARNFQVHISTWDSPEGVTITKIQQDIPDLVIDNPEQVAVAGGRGVTFLSHDVGSTLITREIWFSYGEKLYQVSTYKDFDQTMVDILSTWKWVN